jgi:hypothetical protein
MNTKDIQAIIFQIEISNSKRVEEETSKILLEFLTLITLACSNLLLCLQNDRFDTSIPKIIFKFNNFEVD